MKKLFFTPGPSQLYFTVESHLKEALLHNVPSISHRSKDYVKIQTETESALRELLDLPDHFTIGFTSSATEVWERMGENLVEEHSFHFVNGSFSEKFYKALKDQNKNAVADIAEFGTANDILNAEIAQHTELITLAQNETSTGVALPEDEIHQLKDKHPNALIAVDAVSSLPIAKFDFDKIDSLYFSVQKCFGLPAGLGVWIFNERCVAKAQKLKEEGKYHETYNSLLNIYKFSKKHQTSCTPNVLNIYLLGKVVTDMLNRGIDQLRRDATYKSALIYQLFESNLHLSPFVKEKKYRSKTVGIAEVNGGSEKLMKALADQGLMVGNGYSQFKNQQIRIASFPTHSNEQIEMLVDKINSLEF